MYDLEFAIEELPFSWTTGRTGTLRYVRVDYSTRAEGEVLATVRTGGRVTRNLYTALRETGSLPWVGDLDIGDDLIRIYYDIEDANGQVESVAIATMHAVQSRSTYRAAAEESELTLMSALLTLEQTVLEESLTIASGSNAVEKAEDICANLGLPVVVTDSSKTLTADASWNAGTNYLEIVNWLLTYAGYWSAHVDAYGRVVMAPYQSPEERQPLWEFSDGANCVFVPEVGVETDAFDVPNVYILLASRLNDTPLVGEAVNNDPSSPYSTVTRGRQIARVETVDAAASKADLDALAEQKLLAATAATEKYTIRHAYVPVTIGDVCRLRWTRHGINCLAYVQSQEISLGPACMTTSTLKRIWT